MLESQSHLNTPYTDSINVGYKNAYQTNGSFRKKNDVYQVSVLGSQSVSFKMLYAFYITT